MLRDSDIQKVPLVETRPPTISVNIDHNFVRVMQSSINQLGEQVCSKSKIKLANLSPSDLENLHPTSLYLYEPVLQNLSGLNDYLRSCGVDMFHLEGITTIWDGGEKIKISPPILARNSLGEIEVIDGLHRLFLAKTLGIDIDCIVIDQVDTAKLTDGLPVNWSDVTIFDRFPKDSQKKRRRSNADPSKRLDLSAFGSGGQRISPDRSDMISRFPFDIKLPEDPAERQKARNALNALKKYSGFFPTAFSPENQPPEYDQIKVVEVIGTKELGNSGFGLLGFKVSYEEGVLRDYWVVVEISKQRLAHASTQVLITDEAVYSRLKKPKATKLTSDQVLELKEQLSSFGIDNLFFNNQEQLPEDSLKVTSFEIESINSSYYSVVILHLEDGSDQISVANRERGYHHEQGNIYLFQDEKQYLLQLRWRELMGVYVLEAPRCFGNDYQRIKAETGVNEDKLKNVSKRTMTIPEDQRFKASGVTIRAIENIDFNFNNMPHSQLNEGSREKNIPILLSKSEIIEKIISGEIICDLTTSAIFLDMFHAGELEIDESLLQKYLTLEVKHHPIDGYYLNFPSGPNGSGVRMGPNTMPDDGSSLGVFEHPELINPWELDPTGHYVSLKIEDLLHFLSPDQGFMEIDGCQIHDLDSTTAAHLARAFLRLGILKYRSK